MGKLWSRKLRSPTQKYKSKMCKTGASQTLNRVASNKRTWVITTKGNTATHQANAPVQRLACKWLRLDSMRIAQFPKPTNGCQRLTSPINISPISPTTTQHATSTPVNINMIVPSDIKATPQRPTRRFRIQRRHLGLIVLLHPRTSATQPPSAQYPYPLHSIPASPHRLHSQAH